MNSRFLAAIASVSLIVHSGASIAGPSGASVAFSDATAEAGLAFAHACAADHPGRLMTGGGTVGDFNRDGLPDLFVVGSGVASDRLYINQGGGAFADETAAWGLTAYHRGTGATAGDFDNDGLTDIYVTSMGPMTGEPTNGAHRLYKNLGSSFVDVAEAAGVNQTAAYRDGYGAAFGDIDLDGDLDLWVGGWHFHDGSEFDEGSTTGLSLGNRLFRNDGDGTFTDVTEDAGVFDTVTRGFGAVFVDLNEDRYPELLIAGDFGTTRYFMNNRNGTFTRGGGILSDLVHNGMGTTVGDLNRDGLVDWFVTSIYPAWRNAGPPGNRLYFGLGGGLFWGAPPWSGVDDGGWGWGTTAVDFNHDGWLDIAMTNGFPFPDPVTGATFVDEPSYLFVNNADGTFTESGVASGFVHTLQGRGLVHLDYDDDGDMDIVIFTNDGPLSLFRTELAGPDNHWLSVALDTSGNPALAPEGFGTRVEIRVEGKNQVAIVNGGSNYLGRSQLRAHFGLREGLGIGNLVDQVTVKWADGFRTVLKNVEANRTLVIEAEKPYFHGPLVRGSSVDFVVNGVLPGESVLFLFGLGGTGEGPCYGELCLDILAPLPLGTAVANDGGLAVMTVEIPTYPWFPELHTQAVVLRGALGALSVKTNTMSAPFVDPDTVPGAESRPDGAGGSTPDADLR